MNKFLTIVLFALLASNSLRADLFDITVNITQSFSPTVIPVGTSQGYFTTNAACTPTPCSITAGSITQFVINLATGSAVTSGPFVSFNAMDSNNSGSSNPQYNALTKILSGEQSDLSLLLIEHITTTSFNDIIQLQLSPTTLDTPPACVVHADDSITGTGCVSVRPSEGVFAVGTYTFTEGGQVVPEPSAIILLASVLALLGAGSFRKLQTGTRRTT